jgi:hypothetical protein
MSEPATQKLYSSIAEVITRARNQVVRSVNTAMVEAYWNIGRLIVEEEQQGGARAEYAAGLLDVLAEKLSREFGRGSMKAICAECACFTAIFQFVPHCGTNWRAPEPWNKSRFTPHSSGIPENRRKIR